MRLAVLTALLCAATASQDWSSAKAGTRAPTHHSTKHIVGTGPYMPPEYASSGRVSAKTDTYAYGVVLLELLTGRPPVSGATPQTRESLAMATHEQLQKPKRHMRQLADARAGAWDAAAWCALAAVARRCVAHNAADRSVVADEAARVDALAGRGRAGTGLRWFSRQSPR